MNGVLAQLKSKLTAKDLLTGHFGIERESLRINSDGSLALTPHPVGFGDKMFHPYITTDFSESQVEMITPTFDTLEETYNFLEVLYHLVVTEIQEELLWPQSMPCPLKAGQEIPIAMFNPSEAGQKAMDYRASLLDKYGGKRQLICGIHYNFSFSDSLLEVLYENEDSKLSFQLFKDSIYLKVVRNYIRYRWFLIYFLGASPVVDSSYCSECQLSSSEVAPNSYSHSGAISFRNSLCGYQNKQPIYVDYSTVKTYVSSLNHHIEAGAIESVKEFYSPIRLKSKQPDKLLESLVEDGIEYLEIRSIDLNPFAKLGISLDDLHFIQLFVLFLLNQEENQTDNWQQEALENEKRVAVSGLGEQVELKLNGESISLERWGVEILNQMAQLNEMFDLEKEELIERKRHELSNQDLTLSGRLVNQIQSSNYLATHLKLAHQYKEQVYRDPYQMKGYESLELSTQVLIKEAIKQGIQVKILDWKENFIKLSKGNRVEYIKQATKTSLDRYSTVLAMENKVITKQILAQNKLNVPKGQVFQNIQEAQKMFSQWLGKSIVIKPKSTNFGKGITILEQLKDEEPFNEALEYAFSMDNEIIIEEFIEGEEYRFLVIDHQIIGVLKRVPANVIGDGQMSIKELIELKNRDRIRGEHYRRPLEKIKVDEVVRQFLNSQGLTLTDIPSKGKQVFLRENSNISTGGDSVDVTDEVSAFYKKIAIQSADAMNAAICGVDMIIEDIKQENGNYSVLELNFNPALHIHAYPFKGIPRQVALPILKALQFTD